MNFIVKNEKEMANNYILEIENSTTIAKFKKRKMSFTFSSMMVLRIKSRNSTAIRFSENELRSGKNIFLI